MPASLSLGGLLTTALQAGAQGWAPGGMRRAPLCRELAQGPGSASNEGSNSNTLTSICNETCPRRPSVHTRSLSPTEVTSQLASKLRPHIPARRPCRIQAPLRAPLHSSLGGGREICTGRGQRQGLVKRCTVHSPHRARALDLLRGLARVQCSLTRLHASLDSLRSPRTWKRVVCQLQNSDLMLPG